MNFEEFAKEHDLCFTCAGSGHDPVSDTGSPDDVFVECPDCKGACVNLYSVRLTRVYHKPYLREEYEHLQLSFTQLYQLFAMMFRYDYKLSVHSDSHAYFIPINYQKHEIEYCFKYDNMKVVL